MVQQRARLRQFLRIMCQLQKHTPVRNGSPCTTPDHEIDTKTNHEPTLVRLGVYTRTKEKKIAREEI